MQQSLVCVTATSTEIAKSFLRPALRIARLFRRKKSGCKAQVLQIIFDVKQGRKKASPP